MCYNIKNTLREGYADEDQLQKALGFAGRKRDEQGGVPGCTGTLYRHDDEAQQRRRSVAFYAPSHLRIFQMQYRRYLRRRCSIKSENDGQHQKA